MSDEINKIPVIDLFAGPGGLGEGFSSLTKNGEKIFDIKISIEKDADAHKTLELRSFFRQFKTGSAPEEYYRVLEATNLEQREDLKNLLYKKYPKEYGKAKNEAWRAELGGKDFPPDKIDDRIKANLKGTEKWVLIGGPPCQAYSLVGRSRVGGIDKEDERVYLYREYLRIIASHHPSVFVMENVKGLLSAKINGEKIFTRILEDLQNPSSVFKDKESQNYKIYSLTTEPSEFKDDCNPLYKNDKDFLIKSEYYGIPQKRHRIILLGIREDIKANPKVLNKAEKQVVLKDVIGDLPEIRSGLNRKFVSSKIINGKKKRKYEKVIDSDKEWTEIINVFREEIISWNGFAKNYSKVPIEVPKHGIGSEFITSNTPSERNPLYDWFKDNRLKGISNHESRAHLIQDLKRYMFSAMFTKTYKRFPRLQEYNKHSSELLPDHENVKSGKFADRFRVQVPDEPATTVTSHISKDGHYFIHYDADQCRSLTVREAARIQTFPDNYLFCGSRTAQFQQVGNAVPPYLAKQIAEIVYELILESHHDS